MSLEAVQLALNEVVGAYAIAIIEKAQIVLLQHEKAALWLLELVRMIFLSI